ncbi:MOSC domain-containing protein [Salinicoccus cyprini]|uniref:MOSC domain-containing protein n=1 Tax=Salinicoccus cyprini TaxID=2493691 RepID=A0A558AS40_9STAP|nr:MOSC domain-containing protein [Salinicoccus cyprini]TVT27083.1 MOSC domain-containing protein [Salinicoccus cyprini]
MEQEKIYRLFTGKVKKVGQKEAENKMDQEWESAIFKTVTEGPVHLTKTGFVGDDVADKKNHGGPEKAVFAYPVSHYESWRRELDADIEIGGNGENFAVMHMDETSVCIGDTYKVGGSVLQVSQPRRPCWKPARRHNVLDLALRIQKTGRTGWYFRVIEEGDVESGDTFQLISRPHPDWSIEACNEVMYNQKDNIGLNESLASLDLLAESWKTTISKRLSGDEGSSEKRVFGPNR